MITPGIAQCNNTEEICFAKGITNDHILQFLGTVSKPEVPDGKVQLLNKNNCPTGSP